LTPRSGSRRRSSSPRSARRSRSRSAGREAPRLGERPEDDEALEALEQPERRVDGLRVDVVDERLVDEHDDALGQALEQRGELVDRHELAGRVVRVAQHDDARALVDRRQQRVGVEALDRDGERVRPAGHERIERIRRPGRDELVVGLEQRARRRVQQLGGAVADDDLLGRDAVAVGDLRAQGARARVDVAVQALARGVRDRVDDVVVRQPGPRRAREVDGVDALERLALALVGLLAQLPADLLRR
jgi:hypothetical protein